MASSNVSSRGVPRCAIWFKGNDNANLSDEEQQHFQTIITNIIGNHYIKNCQWSFEYQDGDDVGEFEVRLKKFVDYQTANKIVEVIKANIPHESTPETRLLPLKYECWLRSAQAYTYRPTRKVVQLGEI